MMVVQYACDQLIGIDNTNIKECLASDAQNIRMLSKKTLILSRRSLKMCIEPYYM